MAAQDAANTGASLSTVLDVQLPFPLTVLYSCILPAKRKVLTASAILKNIVTTSTTETCAWDSGLVIARVMETPTPAQIFIQCPVSSLKKFLEEEVPGRSFIFSCITHE